MGHMSHYSRKHPPETKPDPTMAIAAERAAQEGRISCAAAHDLARDVGTTPAEIGRTLDLLEYRIFECQMGIFGHSPEKKVLKPAREVTDELRELLESIIADERVSCAGCWQIAETLGLQKIEVAAACETLGIKIKPCQLGAF